MLSSSGVCVSPCYVGNIHDRVAECVTSDLQHAARDEQKEQKRAAHDNDQVHPHALPVENKQRERENSWTLFLKPWKRELELSSVISPSEQTRKLCQTTVMQDNMTCFCFLISFSASCFFLASSQPCSLYF